MPTPVEWWYWGFVALALVPVMISVSRSADLFVVKVQNGNARFLRGRLPRALLHEIEDIVEKPPVSLARLRAVRSRGAAEWRFEGEVSEAQRQQLRNVLAMYSLPRIEAGARPSRS